VVLDQQTAALAFGAFSGELLFHLLQQLQQKNMMEQVGQHPNKFKQQENLAGAGTQTAGLFFGGEVPPNTGATEEWTGAGAAVTKTITVS
jgi:hypothetical protein